MKKNQSTKKAFRVGVGLISAVLMMLAGCEPDAQKAFVSSFNQAAEEAMTASASPSASAEPSPSPSSAAASTPKQETVVIKPAKTGTLDQSQKSLGESASFYTYKEMAQGYLLFSGEEARSVFGDQRSIEIITAGLELTKHEYHSADGLSADVTAFLSGSQSYDFKNVLQFYEDAQKNGVTQVTFSAEGEKTDSFDVTDILNKAIQEGWLNSDTPSDLYVFFSLTDKTTEHSAEWFGIGSATPPQLTITYTIP